MADNVKTVTIKINGQDAIVELDAIKKALKETKTKLDETKDTNLGNFTSQLSNLKEAFKNGEIGAKGLATGVLQVGKAMIMAFITNPILLAIGAIVGAVMILVNIFKDFEPLVEKIEQAFASLAAVWTVFKTSVTQFITTNKSFADSFGNLGSEMKKAAEEAKNLKMAEQDLEDQAKMTELTNKELENQMQKLILQSKNKTLTEKERMDMLAKADGLEMQIHDNRKKEADEEARINEAKILVGRQLSEEQLANIKKLGIAEMYRLADQGVLDRKKVDAYQATQLKLVDIDNDSTRIKEKNFNRSEALEQAAQAKRDKAVEDEKARVKAEADLYFKAIDNRQAAREKIWELGRKIREKEKAEDDKERERKVKDLDYITKKQEEALAKRTKDHDVWLNDQIDNEKNSTQVRLAGLDEYIRLAKNRTDIGEEEKKVIIRKAEEEKTKITQEAEDKKFEIARMSLDTISNLDKAATQGAIAIQNQKLKNGKITQEEYDRNVADIQAKAAKREKAYAIAAAIINTAQGVSKALTLAPPMSFILAAATAALGLAQVATILATKIDGNSTTTPSTKGSTATPDTGTAPNTSFSFAAQEKSSSSQPIKTYVLTKDVQNSQQMERAVVANGSI